MKRTDILPAAIIALIIAAMALTFFAHPAYAQDGERCTVQTFDPPIGPVFAMPGDADTIRITLSDGSGQTLIGPFVQGDIVDAGGLIISLEKCTGTPVVPTPEVPTVEPDPTPTPEVPTVDPTPTPPDGTTIVTPGPEPTPTPIIPTPPTPPVDPTPTPETPTATPTPDVPTATPTPDVPTLPVTGSSTALLAVIGFALIATGGVLMAARR